MASATTRATQARRLSITLNRTAELADWDLGTLTAHLDELQGDQFDPEDLGFSDEEFTRLLSDFGEALPPEPELPQSDDSDDKGLPPGTEAGHLPSSSARMVDIKVPSRQIRRNVTTRRSRPATGSGAGRAE